MSVVAVPTFEEARRLILERVSPLEAERVELLSSLGRVLAEDVVAPWPLPPFTNSSMDGFAARIADCAPGSVLRVTGHIRAGGQVVERVQPGTAVKIMTGAPVPDGCDCIVPIEDVEALADEVRVVAPVRPQQHIRFAGEDVRAGEVILAAGRVVRPYEINLLASCGHAKLAVVRRPRVAIVATGDELVELGETPAPGRIVNSNAYSLAASVQALGAIPVMMGIARDNSASHREILAAGLEADALITSAGVSVGDHDMVREVLQELGVQIVFWRAKVKPGKSLAFGTRQGRPIFALPGNPVSTMLTFDEFVAPALLKMMGHARSVKPMFYAVLQSALKKKPGMTYLVRVKLDYENGRYLAWSAGRQDTGLVKTLVEANGIAVLPPEREEFAAGEVVPVHLLDESIGTTGE